MTQISVHASSTYPEECCGLLVGRFDGLTKIVTDSKKMENVFRKEERYHRYTIDPLAYMRAENEVTSKGEEIVGIYHSHPDAPAKPSVFDQNNAWPGLSYVVMEVCNSEVINTRSWILKEDRSEFLEEEIENRGKD